MPSTIERGSLLNPSEGPGSDRPRERSLLGGLKKPDKKRLPKPIDREYAVGDSKHNTLCPGALCPCAERIGNMSVLLDTVTPAGKRELLVVAGPYWPQMVLITIPVIIGSSVLVSLAGLSGVSHHFVATYWGLTLWTCAWLLATGLSDPGIVPFYAEPPEGANWPFSQQARSYRPNGALYSRECNVIVSDLDHVCPWSGTAIGEKNLTQFRIFTYSLYALVLVDVTICLSSAYPDQEKAAVFWVLGAALFALSFFCACVVWCVVPSETEPGELATGSSYGAVQGPGSLQSPQNPRLNPAGPTEDIP
mmetsp:Transcript_5810/g.13444  ORF Transcript_5810/g.13444 Transcript_5810/m.13444 type:complete len:306 (+) Transcript_5810:350-1267(+)|eukprot:CAMPEP_0172635118 /NCGR_PEP_ID=MMETSP1068-20121228/197697_1 /TAXON_ID=35684 /ORGANISM="Pseudopedinella elastica, Strain CCMP716" /LENGTH=305 /DNA_ID=CAMNT_0013447233 /DNA_START=209 /DNA_END=1126 /DNA_ORIENTATION=-